MSYKKAEILPRFVAAIIDGVIGGLAAGAIPVVGFLLSALYTLLKDGIMYEILKNDEWKNKSIGKKLMNLEVVPLDGGYMDLSLSAKRNIPFALGSFIAIVPVIGWFIGLTVSLVFNLIELYLIFKDSHGRRLGDRWANTQVIQIETISIEGDEALK